MWSWFLLWKVSYYHKSQPFLPGCLILPGRLKISYPDCPAAERNSTSTGLFHCFEFSGTLLRGPQRFLRSSICAVAVAYGSSTSYSVAPERAMTCSLAALLMYQGQEEPGGFGDGFGWGGRALRSSFVGAQSYYTYSQYLPRSPCLAG